MSESLLASVPIGAQHSRSLFSNPIQTVVRYVGKFEARGGDSHLFLRFDGRTDHYLSYAVSSHRDFGAANVKLHDNRGFYLGRNGWYRDADISIEYTLSVKHGQDRIGFGTIMYVYDDGTMVTFRSRGVWRVANEPIKNAELWAVGGGQTVGDFREYSY